MKQNKKNFKLKKGKLYKVLIKDDPNLKFRTIKHCKYYDYKERVYYLIFPLPIFTKLDFSFSNLNDFWKIRVYEESIKKTNEKNNVYVVYIGTEKINKEKETYREHYNHIFYKDGKFIKLSVFPNGKTKNEIYDEFIKVYSFEEVIC